MKKMIFGVLATALALLSLSGCEAKPRLNPAAPTVVTVWHSYNSYAKTVFDSLVLEFNETVGAEEGIVIDTYNFSDAKLLDDAVYNSANNIIGSEPMPHVFTSYPNNAYRVDRLVPLVLLDKYFSEEELGEYRREFLMEGVWNSGVAPKMLPVAKSTELLYLNQTSWSEFAVATGADIQSLSTWEGLAETAELYYNWSGGSPMLGFNPFNDFMALTSAQFETQPFEISGDKVTFNYNKQLAAKVWEVCYIPHIKGYYGSETYGSDGIKRGSLIGYIGSSAGAGFFPSEVTVSADNIYPIECTVLPYPTFRGSEAYMGQRGANMCIVSSDEAHEYASSVFLKWLTSPEQNLRFTISTGYIPVTNKALSSMNGILETDSVFENKAAVEKCIATTMEGMSTKKVHSQKAFSRSYEASDVFYNSIFTKVQKDLQAIDKREQAGETRQALIAEFTSEDAFEAWYNKLCTDVSDTLKEKELQSAEKHTKP